MSGTNHRQAKPRQIVMTCSSHLSVVKVVTAAVKINENGVALEALPVRANHPHGPIEPSMRAFHSQKAPNRSTFGHSEALQGVSDRLQTFQ
jgi:hypothetical protein